MWCNFSCVTSQPLLLICKPFVHINLRRSQRRLGYQRFHYKCVQIYYKTNLLTEVAHLRVHVQTTVDLRIQDIPVGMPVGSWKSLASWLSKCFLRQILSIQETTVCPYVFVALTIIAVDDLTKAQRGSGLPSFTPNSGHLQFT